MVNEKRLIDANLMALNELEAYMSAQTKIESPITLGLNSVVHRKIQQLIADTPTVDAVAVVRCKDCKHRYSDSWCEYVDDDDNFYCARGERKEGSD